MNFNVSRWNFHCNIILRSLAHGFFLVFEAKLAGDLPCTLWYLALRELFTALQKQLGPKKDKFVLAHPDSKVQISFPQNHLLRRKDSGAG